MFNAKSLLDALINAGSQAGTQAGQQGGLGGMLGGLADQVQRSGGIGGLAGQILTQATQGLGDAARQTGVQQGAGEALGRVTGGRTPDQLIEQAKGVLAATASLDMDEAFTTLRDYARAHRMPLRDVAEQVAARTLTGIVDTTSPRSTVES